MYTLSNVRITQNGYVFLVPCELLPYLNEIYELMKTTSVIYAFVEVANKYNIVLVKPEPTKPSYKKPPANPIRVRTNQPVDYFILTTVATNYDYPTLSNYEAFTDDARYITTFNVGQTSMTYATMQDKAYPMSLLFKGTFPKPAICTSIDDSNVRDFVGYILQSRTGLLIFLPMIHTNLRYLYTSPLENKGVFFKQIGCSLEQNSIDVLYKYTGSTALNTNV
jgi:hypothetical protein